MNDPGPAPPVDDIQERDLAMYVRRFRTFLGQQNINDAARRLSELDAEGNPFRRMIVREKQPWVDAFSDFDSRTLNGTRPLRIAGLPMAVVRAAAAGKTLERVEPTLSEPLKEHMRSRLLALHGLSEPVMMEWDLAHFYLRHGFRVMWTGRGTRGPEFKCERGNLRFEVECKRVTRSAKEMLGDREATTLAYGVVRALAERDLCGDIVLETPLTRSPAEPVVIDRVQRAIPVPAPPAIDIDIPEIGHLAGNVRTIPAQAAAGIRQHLDDRVTLHPHDHRAFGITVPLGAPQALDGISLWLRGPRRSQADHLAHIEARVTEAAQQLSGNVPGLVAIELEGITDATLFRNKAPFHEMDQNVFRDYPFVMAVHWRCDLDFVSVHGGFAPNHPTFVEPNGACSFANASNIPLLNTHD